MAYLRKTLGQQDADTGQAGNGIMSGYLTQQQGPFGAAGGVSPGQAYGSGPTTTGHVNFDSIYNANSGTAANMANQIGNQVQGDVQGAKKGLANMQQQYLQATNAGAGHGPTGDQIAWARGQAGGSTAPAQTNPVGQKLTSTIGPQTQESPGLQSSPTRNAKAPNRDSAMQAPNGDQSGAIQAGAAQKYGGPNNLQQMNGYGGLLDQYTKANAELGAVGSNSGLQGMFDQQNAGPYIEGGSKLNAALTGQAGRPDFAKLQQMNQGFGNQLGSAVENSQGISAAAKNKSQQNAQAYQGLLGGYGQQTPSNWAPTSSVETSGLVSPNVAPATGMNSVYQAPEGGLIAGNDRPWWNQLFGN